MYATYKSKVEDIDGHHFAINKVMYISIIKILLEFLPTLTWPSLSSFLWGISCPTIFLWSDPDVIQVWGFYQIDYFFFVLNLV